MKRLTKTQTQVVWIVAFIAALTLIIIATGATDGLWLDQVKNLGKVVGESAG